MAGETDENSELVSVHVSRNKATRSEVLAEPVNLFPATTTLIDMGRDDATFS